MQSAGASARLRASAKTGLIVAYDRHLPCSRNGPGAHGRDALLRVRRRTLAPVAAARRGRRIRAGGAVDEEPLALVVLLHGTNPNAYLHLWLGGGGRDLRPFAASLVHTEQVLPFVLAAPSQTRSAGSGAALWNAFQLRTFVEAIEDALVGAVQIDRQRIVIFGHSAAGCNPEGGLASDFWTAEGVSAWALVSVDPCLDAQMGTAMARRPSTVPLWVWWQSRSWQRSPVDFWAALTLMTGDARTDRMQKLAAPGPNPHETIVPLAFERTLRELLRSPPGHD